MREIGVCMQSVLGHWVAWGTGSSLALALAVLNGVCGWKIPKVVFVAFFAFGFLYSGFQAWQDQYRENETGRTVGSLPLERVEVLRVISAPEANSGKVQVSIVLKNLQPRLIEYRVEKNELELQAKKPQEDYANKGGYVYAMHENMFRFPFIQDVDLTQQPLTGILEYAVSYHVIGSGAQHHSYKKIRFTSYVNFTTFVTLSEHED